MWGCWHIGKYVVGLSKDVSLERFEPGSSSLVVVSASCHYAITKKHKKSLFKSLN